MLELDADVGLATDDGFRLYGVQLAFDMDMPVLAVHHFTGEKPGMQRMARYLQEQYPDLPVRYLEGEFPYTTVP